MKETETSLITNERDGAGSSASMDTSRLKALIVPMAPVVRWWLGEIGAMLPLSLRRLFSVHRLQVRASHDKLCFVDPNSPSVEEDCLGFGHTGGTRGASAILRPNGGKQPCELLLDESLVLVREVELPLEAESTLRRVLSFSMDRYTPFTESDVLFDYKIMRRDVVNKKISLTLYVAPRDGVEPAVNALASMGIETATMDVVSDAINGRAGIELCPAEWRSGSAGMGRIEGMLALSALVLLLVVTVLPFFQRHQAAAQLESELAVLRGQVNQAENDRRDLHNRIEHMNLIQQHASATPSVLDILLELTRLMPDESWAGQLTITSGRIRLSGEANAVSELLAHLSKSSLFSDPRFEAPLTQNPKTGHERYVISLAIRNTSDAA